MEAGGGGALAAPPQKVLEQVKRVHPGLAARDCAFAPGKTSASHVEEAVRMGKRDKYTYEVECVTDVPNGCILNR
jgi:hypothetical protein